MVNITRLAVAGLLMAVCGAGCGRNDVGGEQRAAAVPPAEPPTAPPASAPSATAPAPSATAPATPPPPSEPTLNRDTAQDDSQKAAAEVGAAVIPVRRPASPAAPTPATAARDLRRALTEAGFTDASDWSRHLSWYVRFGSYALADKYARGDQFDKIEITTETKKHRDELFSGRFRVTGLKFRPVVRTDLETRGLLAELELPLRVRGDTPFFDDPDSFSGVLDRLHPSELDARQTSFLTKDGKLRACTPADAQVVERNGGVLYHPEIAATTLVLVFKDKVDTLRGLARDAKEYTVELDFTCLCYVRPTAWGFFRRDAYLDADFDCQKLWIDYLVNGAGPQPVYFPTAFFDTTPADIPEMVRGQLESLRVLNKDGDVVGGYRVK